LGSTSSRVGDAPLIMDVNAFPNYIGVEEAPSVIGRPLLDGARRAARQRVELAQADRKVSAPRIRSAA
jgi:hypothetical protein